MLTDGKPETPATTPRNRPKPNAAGGFAPPVIKVPSPQRRYPIPSVRSRLMEAVSMPQTNKKTSDRRQHTRYTLAAGYAPMTIRLVDQSREIEGMAYDISSGGLRFEADEAVRPGIRISAKIELPGEQGKVVAFINVVWLEDEEDPAPYKMAGIFAGFASADDEARLMAALGAGRYRVAA